MKKIIKPKLDNYEFVFEGARTSYFYCTYSIVKTYYYKEGPWKLSVGQISELKNHVAKWYLAVKDIEEFRLYPDKVIKNPELLRKLESYIKKIREETVSKLYKDNTNELSNKELGKLALYYYDQFIKILFAASFLRNIDRGIINRIKKDYNKADEIISNISISGRISFPLEEEISILKLASGIKRDNISLDSDEFKKSIKDIKNKYCWSTCGYFNEKAKTEKKYIEVIKELIKGYPQKELELIDKRFRDNQEKRKSTIKELKENDRSLVNIAAESAFLKDYFKASINNMIYKAEPMFQKIAKRTHFPIGYIKDLLPEEVLDLLNGKKIDHHAIKERINFCIISAQPEYLGIFIGKDAEEISKKYLKQKVEEKKEFKGRIACNGHAKGIAKIVLKEDEFHKLNKGEILVVSSTSPNYVIVMKKAAAILAEVGGLTSHVSVTSREFGIPCIVGLSNITHILKDGDLVEVDANKGIVKILKRK